MVIDKQESDYREDKIAACVDIIVSPDYPNRGYPVAWFNKRRNAEDYLRQVEIRIDRIYLVELEPIGEKIKFY